MIHPFLPFFESPLECVVDDGIYLLGVGFEEVEIKYVNGILAFVFSFAVGGEIVQIPIHELLGIFDIFKCLFEIVLTTVALLVTLLNKF